MRVLSNPFYIRANKVILYIATMLLTVLLFHPGRFASEYKYIQTEKIVLELDQSYLSNVNTCAITISGKGNSQLIYPTLNHIEEPSTLAQRLSVLPGGQWKPIHCKPLYNMTIIISYRNRQNQLNIFMSYIHPFLQLQKLSYRIFVIEQSKTKEFNRAKLFNIGFTEATKVSNYQCFIFQDIDLIPQNPDNIYACTSFPRHLSSSVNTFRYNLPYTGLLGGVISITTQQFRKVNGFSNVFFGWGGEDDDFFSRLQSRNLQIVRFSPDVAQYYMLSHKKEIPNIARFSYLESGLKRMDTDGLKDLKFKVIHHQLRPLYSWVLVDI